MRKFIIISSVLLASSGNMHAQLTNSGNIRTFAGANVTIYGDVTNNGSIADSATLITLAGSSLQTFGGSSVTTLKNLRLNNSSLAGITLAQALNVRGTLTFSTGRMNTTATNILTFTSTATAMGANNNSFVSGPTVKTGNSSFVFPVGKNAVYAPIAISAPAAGTDQFTAEYFQVSPNIPYSTWSLEPTLHHVSECEYWMLNRTTGASDVAVTLSWDVRSCGVTFLSDLRVARWDGTQWTDKGNGGTTGNTTAGTVISAAPVTGFGPFTLASTSSANPLPVELLSFTATCEQEQAILRWSTASEFQNDFFTIEYSSDATDWNTLATVESHGTTHAQSDYSWSDPSAPTRNAYYRLSQTNSNGEIEIHGIAYIQNCQDIPENTLTLYPNPAKDRIRILTEAAISDITVLNAEGKQVGNITADLKNKELSLGDLPNGVYVVRITTPSGVFHEKVVISRD